MGVSICSDRELRVIDKGGKRGKNMEIGNKIKEARNGAGLTRIRLLRRLWFRGRRYPTGKMEFPIVKDTTPKITNPRLYDTA